MVDIGKTYGSGGWTRARNVVFVVVVAILLFSVIGYKAYKEIADMERSGRSVLEHRNYQTFPDLAWDSILDGTFQDDFEQYVSDSLPIRDQILLNHAAIQRSSIEFANLVCGYDAYPTFYGSDYVYIQSTGAIWSELKTMLYYPEDELAGLAETYSQLADDNPDTDWVMYLVDRSEFSEASSLNELSTDVAGYDYIYGNFCEQLSDSWTTVYGGYDDLDEFLENYSLTDHHWNVKGAMEAYGKIVEALEKDPIDFGDVYEAYSGSCWGAYARMGMASIGEGDVIYDVEYDHSDLVVTVNGTEEDISFLDQSWAEDYEGYSASHKFTAFYTEYYHVNKKLIEIENPSCDDGETLLILEDSFGNVMERFFAEDYEYVYVINMSLYDRGTVQEFIDQNGVDDVVCILSPPSLGYLEDLV